MGHILIRGRNLIHSVSIVDLTFFYISEFPNFSNVKDLFELFG